MNTKKLALFAGAAVVIAGGLVYTLGIYPPGSGRDGQGAIGQRQVYRAEQPKDATVTPGTAPVAMQVNAEQMKKGEIFQLKNAQIVQTGANQFALQTKNGELLLLNSQLFTEVHSDLASHLAAGQIMQVSPGQLMVSLSTGVYNVQLTNNAFLKLADGAYAELRDGALIQQLNGNLVQLSPAQINANFNRQ